MTDPFKSTELYAAGYPSPEQLSPLQTVDVYLGHIYSGDPKRILKAPALLDDVFYHSLPGEYSAEPVVPMVYANVMVCSIRPTDENYEQLRYSQSIAISRVIHGMISGDKFPVDDFGVVIERVTHQLERMRKEFVSAAKIIHSPNAMVHAEIMEAWKSGKSINNPARMRRAAKAYKTAGGYPMRYGLMMARVARAERQNQ